MLAEVEGTDTILGGFRREEWSDGREVEETPPVVEVSVDIRDPKHLTVENYICLFLLGKHQSLSFPGPIWRQPLLERRKDKTGLNEH